MLEIVLNKVNKNFGNKQLLKNVSFEIKTNERVALIGQNGCGKTTILKMIAKEENISSGDIFIRKDAKVGILTQQPDPKLYDFIVKDILYSAFEKVNKLKEKLDIEEEKLSSTTDKELEKAIERYTKLQEEYIRLGGYEIDSKIPANGDQEDLYLTPWCLDG